MTSELQLYGKLNDELLMLADNFGNLLKAARIQDDAEDQSHGRDRKAPGDLMDVIAEQLIYNAHQCVNTTSELKKSAILSDFKALSTSIRAVRSSVDKHCGEVDVQLRRLREDAHALLADLEDHYYSSAHRSVDAIDTVVGDEQP